MKFAQRTNSVEPSLARALFNKAKEYDNVIDLTLGDPDFNTPESIKRAGCLAIENNYTHYSANAGLPQARIAVAKNIRKQWGEQIDPNNQIVLTVGGMEALFLSLACLIDAGDEVLIFAPYYVNYAQMIRFFGGVPVIVNAYKKTRDLI